MDCIRQQVNAVMLEMIQNSVNSAYAVYDHVSSVDFKKKNWWINLSKNVLLVTVIQVYKSLLIQICDVCIKKCWLFVLFIQ